METENSGIPTLIKSVPSAKGDLPPEHHTSVRLRGIQIDFQPDRGICTFDGVPMTMMWIDSTLAGLMSGFQHMVGTARFVLALKGEGRRSIDGGDWNIIVREPTFEQGFAALANIAAIAGWGKWEVVRLDYTAKEAVFRAWNSWEGLYQLHATETWGSPMLAGKMAGYCSRLFGVNCWAEQTSSIAAGDDYDEFFVKPSERMIEKELEELLHTDQATKADMAFALEKLRKEIAERQKTEAQLVAAKKAAEAANQAKSQFLANMSHEIRTPLTAIIGFTELIAASEALPSELRRHVDTVERNSRQLLQLINDILDISRIEANTLSVVFEEFSLDSILNQVCSNQSARAQKKGLFLSVSYGESVTAHRIYTDPTRLTQILANIIGNAVKFTDSGGVSVVVDEMTTDGTAWLVISVKDTGPGISADQMEHLFKPFAPGDLSRTKHKEGTGLGLAISKRLAVLLGGNIRVSSTVGEGSEFIVSIPVSRSATTPAPGPLSVQATSQSRSDHLPPGETTGLSGRILVAEDQADTRELLEVILTGFGLTTVFASNGLEAERILNTDRGIDLALMDVQMPQCDGLTATRTLRAKGWNKPIIAMTAYAMAEDRAHCLEAGCNDYVSKPIDQNALFQLLKRYL